MIRPAQPADVTAVYDLMCNLEDKQFDFASFKANYEYLLNHEEVTMLVYEDTTVKGFMNMVISLHLHHNDWVAEIKELIVDPAFRSQRIGQQLFHEAIQIAKEKKCVRIELSSNQKRVNAHRFYEREGMNKSHYNFTLDL